MNKLKVTTWLLISMFVGKLGKAQSIDDARKLLYYEKYKSAAAAFQSLVTANPANAEAAYWLGQTYLRNFDNPDVAAAKAVFQKALQASNSNPLLIVGMGQVNLIEGNTQEARNNFEAAIGTTQGKNIAVLNAIGSGINNALSLSGDKKYGDPAYAVEKLKLAITLKGFKDPDVYINLGDSYRKLETDGANAFKSYKSALELDPNNAKALVRIAKIYQSQGVAQKDIFLDYFDQAIAKDPNYGPAYYALYDAYLNMEGMVNVPKAAEYLDKYFATTENPNSSENCYYRASILFQQAKFQEAINKAKECISVGGADAYVKNYLLIAYSAVRINDSLTAKTNFEIYFQKQKPGLITPKDMITYARILNKFPGNEATAGELFNKAIDLDSTEAGKVEAIKEVASNYEKQKMYKEAAEWYKKVLTVKKAPSKTDVFNVGYNYFSCNFNKEAVDYFTMLTTKYPDDVFGYDMKGRAERYLDSTLVNGLANPTFQKVVDLGEAQWATDSAKVKTQLLRAYKYFIEYYANVKKDNASALAWSERYLLKEPNDAEVRKYRDLFAAPPARPTTPRPGTTKPPATPKTPGTKKKK